MPVWARNLLAVLISVVFFWGFYLLFLRPGAYRIWGCPCGKAFSSCQPCGFSVTGLDISHYQGKIDWDLVVRSARSQGHPLSFVFAKATEGSDLRDENYLEYSRDIRKAGLIWGAYHFFSPSTPVEQQARLFIDNAALRPGDLPPVVDVETRGSLSRKELAGRVIRLLEILEAHYGVRPILYASYKFRRKYLSDAAFDGYPYWIAHYYADHVSYGGQWSFWQHSDSGQVPGIRGNVDLDVFRGNQKELEAMRIPQSNPRR